MPVTSKSGLAQVARWSWKIAIGLIAFVLLAVFACFAVNSIDVPLSEQAKALLTGPPNPYRSDDNIYLAMAGFDSAGQRSVIDMGAARIDAYNQALDSMLLDPDAAVAFNESASKKLSFSGTAPLGPALTSSIWMAAKSHRRDIATLLTSNEELYRRYMSMHHLTGYYETARPSYMMPLAFIPPPVRVLFLSDLASRLQTGTLQQQRDALDDLRDDLRMWRVVLKGSGALISKMVAAASLHADFLLLADMIADPNSDLALLENDRRSLIEPFDLADWKIGAAFRTEFRAAASLYKTIPLANAQVAGSTAQPSSWRERAWNVFQVHFFNLNDTENLSAALTAQWEALADSDPTQIYGRREAYVEWLKQNGPHLSPAALYNPIGKILVGLAVPTYDAYPMRVFDVAAYQRLVYLVFQLRRQNIPTSDVAMFLLQHPEWSTHPVDGKSFRWNPETGELAVNTVGKHPEGRRFGVMFRQDPAIGPSGL